MLPNRLYRNLFTATLCLGVSFGFAPTFGHDQDPAKVASSISDEKWRGGYLGIVPFQPKRAEPVTIGRVINDSPAQKAELQKGDVILQVDGTKVESIAELKNLLKAKQPFDSIQFEIQRDDETFASRMQLDPLVYGDMYNVAEAISRNRVLNRYLKERNKTDLLDKAPGRLEKVVRASKSHVEARRAMNEVLDLFNVSHTAIVPAEAMNGLKGDKPQGSFGLELRMTSENGKSIMRVSDIMPGSPAAESELGIGDEVRTIDGIPAAESPRIQLSGHEHRYHLYAIQAKPDDEMTIVYRSTNNVKPSDLKLKSATDINPLSATRDSVRVIEESGYSLGYLRLWNVLSSETSDIAEEAIEKRLKNCDGLLIDLRGRGGSVLVLMKIAKLLKDDERPTVAIIDGDTRSAKEVLAWRLREHRYTKLVGQRTAGAVTGAGFQRLPSGDYLMYPVAPSESLRHLTGGEALEGVGVKPDIEFQPPINPSTRDALFDRAKKELVRALKTHAEFIDL